MTKARVLAALLIAAVAACATLSGESSDKAAIRGVLGQWRSALSANDLDRAMSLYSEQFKSGDMDKAAEAKFLKAAMDEEGFGTTSMIIFEHATIAVKGDRASVIPIAVSGKTGSESLGLDFVRENGQWRICGMTN
jgi:ketosteroid isomerase-like protein